MLSDTILSITTKLHNKNLKALDSDNTTQSFILPIMARLGWDIFDGITKGYIVEDLDQGSPLSCSFNRNGKPILLIDVKPLYSSLIPVHAKTLRTAYYSLAKYLVMSNGVDWHIYNVESREEDSEKLLLSFTIKDDRAEEMINLLSPVNIEDGLLDQYVLENIIQKPEEVKFKIRSYKTTQETHDRLNMLKVKINSSRRENTEVINNNVIVETLLEVFLDAAEKNFDAREIPNSVFLRSRIIDCLKK